MVKSAKLLVFVPATLTVAWLVSAMGNEKNDLEQHVRVALSQPLPQMNGDHLEGKAVEVTYEPGGHNVPHTHPLSSSRVRFPG